MNFFYLSILYTTFIIFQIYKKYYLIYNKVIDNILLNIL